VIAARAAGQPLDSAPWGPHAVTADYHAVPQVFFLFFCDPQAGAAGLTAEQAERAGHRIRVVDVDPGEKVAGAGCTPTATPAAPAWSSTRTTAACWASP
jgi:pyruvate/2-oxoglutarate dehydrogenase complex dihydrolipoamide dehydrogenase (E3) component